VLAVLEVQLLALLVVLALVVGFSLGHGLRSASRETRKVVAKRDPGRWSEALWLAGSLLSAFWSVGVLLLPSYTYRWPAFPDFPYSSALQGLGFLVALCGGILFSVATRTLGRHMTVAIQVQEGHRLIRDGPYRYVRHPLYTAIVTSTFGLSLLYLSIVVALDAVLLIGLAIYRARLEESLLGSPQAFGQEYAEYVARSGRFLPRFRGK